MSLVIKGFPPTRRGRLVKCIVCRCTVPQAKAFKLPGTGKGYICGQCRDSCRDYSTANYTEKGRACNEPAFSFEFETSEVSTDLLVLYRWGFIPCYDGSIGGREWKSPIYRNLRPLKPILPELERLADSYVDEECGTHIHVACLNKELITPSAWAIIWEPTVSYMLKNRFSTEEFWGRFFNEYASRYVEGQSRYEAFNRRTQYETIEYRLPVFKSARQYEAVIRFARVATRMIDRFFDEHSPDNCVQLIKLAQNIKQKYLNFAE